MYVTVLRDLSILETTLFKILLTVKVEEFSFQNHFKSSRKEDQQVLDRRTLPLALQEVYK